MNVQDCQSHETYHEFSTAFQRIWYRMKQIGSQYRLWRKMKHNHRLLLTMENRLLKDIGLSRADAVRISNAHTFWKFVFQPESDAIQDQSRNGCGE